MKVVGTFYLSSGQVHKEILSVKKECMKSVVEGIEYMQNNFDSTAGTLTFGYFTVKCKDVVGMQFRVFDR